MASTVEKERQAAARSGETREFRATDAPPQKRRNLAIGIGAVIAILVLLWGGQKWLYSRGHESTDDAAVDGHIVPVVAKVGGYVTKVTVAENDHVGSGQLLVQLDTSELAVKLSQANADLAAASHTLNPSIRGQVRCCCNRATYAA